jgi:uncharacterized protein (DUF2267 family)
LVAIKNNFIVYLKNYTPEFFCTLAHNLGYGILLAAFFKKKYMANIQKYAEEANYYLNNLAAELGNPGDTDHAFRITSAFFHTLRERITFHESLHFISQLPMILKGIYVDGWKVTECKKYETQEEVLDEVRNHCSRTAGIDLGNNDEARDKIETVIRVLCNYVSEGEMEHVKAQLPPPIAELFEQRSMTL